MRAPVKPRIATNLPLTWHARIACTIHNISQGGLFFKSSAAPTIGDQLELHFQLPGTEKEITTRAQVRWVSSHSVQTEQEREFGVGAAFVNLTTEEQQLLDTFVEGQMQQRQDARRFPVRLKIEYFFAGRTYKTIANDISQHGMFLITSKPLDLEDIVHTRFTLPNSHALLKVKGVVRWHHSEVPETLSDIIPMGMGIEFLTIAPEDQGLIEEFLVSQTQQI